jgi:hypothetical protein
LISARNRNNGLKSFVTIPALKRHAGHVITLNKDGDGGAGLAYYQPHALALDSHVVALTPKHAATRQQLLFIVAVLSQLHDLFGHGLSISDSRLRRIRILLPATRDGNPDWRYMQLFMEAIEARLLAKQHRHLALLQSKLQPVEG